MLFNFTLKSIRDYLPLDTKITICMLTTPFFSIYNTSYTRYKYTLTRLRDTFTLPLIWTLFIDLNDVLSLIKIFAYSHNFNIFKYLHSCQYTIYIYIYIYFTNVRCIISEKPLRLEDFFCSKWGVTFFLGWMRRLYQV